MLGHSAGQRCLPEYLVTIPPGFDGQVDLFALLAKQGPRFPEVVDFDVQYSAITLYFLRAVRAMVSAAALYAAIFEKQGVNGFPAIETAEFVAPDSVYIHSVSPHAGIQSAYLS